MIEKAQVIPRRVVIRPLGYDFLKNRLGRGIVLLADGFFSAVVRIGSCSSTR
jgi:hypothetical protein